MKLFPISKWKICMCACSVFQQCLTLCNPMDCKPPGSSIHGIFQTRVLEWDAISSSRGPSCPRIEPVSPAPLALSGRFFTTELPAKPKLRTMKLKKNINSVHSNRSS